MTTPTVAASSLSVAEQFERVYAGYQGWLVRWFNAALRDWATSEDLAAEVFASLWRDMSQRGLELAEIERLYGFLAVRGQWVKLAYFERTAARRETAWGHEDGAPDRCEAEYRAAALAPDGPDARVAARLELGEMLAALPSKQRETLALRYLEDLTREQTAVQMGCSVGSVELYAAAGLRALRKAAGVPGATREQNAATHREAMRAAYLASVAEGNPLSERELGKRFGRSRRVARLALEGLERVAVVTAADRMRAGLRRSLTDGTYKPGQRMLTTEIGKQYGVNAAHASRMLSELAAENLVCQRDGGYYAAPALTGAGRPELAMAA